MARVSGDPGVTIWEDELRAALAPAGLNLFGVVSAARYDTKARDELRSERILPGSRSIVVVGSGGRVHWEAFLAFVRADPRERFAQRYHPLDDYCSALFAGLAARGLMDGCRVVPPSSSAPTLLDFVELGEMAGIGRRSEIRLLANERFGPWLALRAAVFTRRVLPETGPTHRMCESCPAPCLAAAPPGVEPAISLSARKACIVSPAERYESLELTYHYDRAAGRRELCTLLGITDEVSTLGALA